jgi:hypothetical protein
LDAHGKHISKTERMRCEQFDSGWERYDEGEKISATGTAPEGHPSTILALKMLILGKFPFEWAAG